MAGIEFGSHCHEDSTDRFRARDQSEEKGLQEQKRDGAKGEKRSIESCIPWRSERIGLCQPMPLFFRSAEELLTVP